jgi:3-methylcrotonyl-CoA carboxylase alpha subunit
MEFRYRDGDSLHVVRVTQQADGYVVQVGERSYRVNAHDRDDSTLELWIDGHYHRARHASRDDERWIDLDNRVHRLSLARRRGRTRQSGEGEDALVASMPGQIISIHVVEGETVERGQLLLLMEAMKMELRVTAPHDGTVAAILVADGEAVERGQSLVEVR